MKKFITLFVLFIGLMTQAQNHSNVEYIQLKRMYEFQDEPNQYRLSSMLKYQFENLGYKVYYVEDGIPEDIKKDRCKQYICNVTRSGKMTVTELTVSLESCDNKVVATGSASSRNKLRKKTYPEVVTTIFEKTAIGQLRKR